MEKKPDHKKLYEKYHASPEAKKDRAARNRNRREFEAEGRVSKGGSNDRSNLRVVSRTTNRAKRDRPS